MGKLDYNEITDNNEFSKSDVGLVCDAVNDNDTRVGNLEVQGGRDVTKYTYGANTRNFQKKARDWRAGRKFALAPKIVIIGDSITGGVWATEMKTHFETEFNIPTDNVTIHWYGGYAIRSFYPFLDDVLINPNPDLIIFNENEFAGVAGNTPDEYLNMIESLFYKIKYHTTADVVVGTWSMDGPAADQYYIDGIIPPDMDSYQFFNWYRDLATRYGFEVVDFNQAILDYIDAGNDPTGHHDGNVHWDSEWYTYVWFAELKKHFNEWYWQSGINQPNPNAKKETYISFVAEKVWDKYKEGVVTFNPDGQWLRSSQKGALRGTSAGAELIIDAKNIIGFEVLTDSTYSTNKDYDILIDGVAPSTMTPFGMLNEYCTEIRSTTYSSNDDLWRLKRPRMIANVTSSFGDNRQTPLRYTMIVTDVTGSPDSAQTVTVDVKNEAGTVIGTFTDLYQDWIVAGLNMSETWNGENNFKKSTTDSSFPASSSVNFAVGDEYEWYIKSNWVDRPNTSDGDNAVVFGLEPNDYQIKVVVVDAGVDVVGIKLYHS